MARVIIDRTGEIRHSSGAVERYFNRPHNSYTRNLLSLARPRLAAKLRGVLERALRLNARQSLAEVITSPAGASRRMIIDVEPLEFSEELLLVTLDEQEPLASTAAAGPGRCDGAPMDQETQLQLQLAREDLEAVLEELKQSEADAAVACEHATVFADELAQTNFELRARIDSLEAANIDVASLLIPSVFLDSKLAIRRFTPAAMELFRFIVSDVGRPLGDIAMNFTDDSLLRDALGCLRDRLPREKEVQAAKRWHLRRIVPHHTLDDVVDGVVLTFVEISERVRAEQELRASRARLASDVAAMRQLQEVSRRLVPGGDAGGLLLEIVDAAMALTSADMGDIKLLDRDSGKLKIVAARGFERPFLERFNAACEGRPICGAKVQNGERVVIADVTTSSLFEAAPARNALLSAGVRALQSTPLVSRSGRVVGVLSTHYRRPLCPTDQDLHVIDLLARLATDWIERRDLEREIAETATLEQQRIGQDLHDRVAQELAALNIVAGSLAETLPAALAKKAAPLIERISAGLRRSQAELRNVLRGLVFLPDDPVALMAAIADLADRVRREGSMGCTFECPAPVEVKNNLGATHLYFIVHEAVQNALKHARCRSIAISLEASAEVVVRVRDDGIGLPVRPLREGLGLRIMHYRANRIGAKLSIEAVEPNGTLVTCAWREQNDG